MLPRIVSRIESAAKVNNADIKCSKWGGASIVVPGNMLSRKYQQQQNSAKTLDSLFFLFIGCTTIPNDFLKYYFSFYISFLEQLHKLFLHVMTKK